MLESRARLNLANAFARVSSLSNCASGHCVSECSTRVFGAPLQLDESRFTRSTLALRVDVLLDESVESVGHQPFSEASQERPDD